MLCLLCCLVGQSPALPPSVGFVSHFPMVPTGQAEYGASGATVALVRAPWALMEPNAGKWDASIIDSQLAWARDQHVRLIYVIECGPAHCVNWVREEARAADGLMKDAAGNTGDPSMFCPTYVERMDAFIRRCVREILDRDQDATVLGFSNGCEWWFPSDQMFGELERAAFEKAMLVKYGSSRHARQSWGLPPDGRIERPPVVFDGVGDPQCFGVLVPLGARVDASWCPPMETRTPVTEGRAYVLEADVRIEHHTSGSAHLQIAWFDAAGAKPVRIDDSSHVRGNTDGWQHIRAEATAQTGFTWAWVHLKSAAAADVSFRNVSFHELGHDANLLANAALDPAAGGWTFIPWTTPDDGELAHEWTPGVLTARYRPSRAPRVNEAWVDSWFEWSGDAAAEFIGHVADVIREVAPTHPVITYLTFSFAAPFNWDYSYAYNIHPEKVFAARHYEGLGMQTAAADGDYHHVTAAVDMVRQMGDPWLIDLQDFTGGVFVGPEAMTRTTVAGVGAGARGVLYYCWYGTPDYDFHGAWPPGNLESMIGETRRVLVRQTDTRPAVDVALLHPKVVPLPGRGEPNPGRFALLYKACRRLGLGVVIVTDVASAPRGVPMLTVDDVPAHMTPTTRRSTEHGGNTPPLFKLAGNDDLVDGLAAILAPRLGASLEPRPVERFPRLTPSGTRRWVEVPRVCEGRP